jgi:hypothetical protein
MCFELFETDTFLSADIENSTFGGTNWSVPDRSQSALTGTTANIGAIDKDCNENPYL